METSARKRYLFCESQGVERTQIILEFDLNEHSVLAALLIDSKNFCGNWSHFASLSTSDFAGDEIRIERFRHGEASGEEIKSRTLGPVAQ